LVILPHGKASVVAAALRPPGTAPAAVAIVCDVMNPGSHQDQLRAAVDSADIIIDVTASIAAERYLSDDAATARRASAFFNPTGEAVVVLV
jgi:hypothetical protein